MIVGLGIDLAEISRFDALLARWGERLERKLFTEGERAACHGRGRPAQHFAARFAAKEAAMKALGTGHALGVFWTGIEVVRRGGPPQLRFHGGAARRFADLGASRALLTLTHSRDLAIAHVLLLR